MVGADGVGEIISTKGRSNFVEAGAGQGQAQPLLCYGPGYICGGASVVSYQVLFSYDIMRVRRLIRSAIGK